MKSSQYDGKQQFSRYQRSDEPWGPSAEYIDNDSLPIYRLLSDKYFKNRNDGCENEIRYQ